MAKFTKISNIKIFPNPCSIEQGASMWKNKKNSNCHWISFGKIFLYFPEAEKQRTTVWQPHRQQLSMSPRGRKPATRSVVSRQPPAPTYWDPPWCSRGGHAFPRLFTANDNLVEGLQPGRFHQCRTLLIVIFVLGLPPGPRTFSGLCYLLRPF